MSHPTITPQYLQKRDTLCLFGIEQDLAHNFNQDTSRRKRSSTIGRDKKHLQNSLQNLDLSVLQIVEENINLENEIKQQMIQFSKENKELRTNLMKSKTGNKINKAEIDKNIDSSLNSSQKSRTQGIEEGEYDEILKGKEEELEKLNHMNASYRAQLIELKISMNKTRDLGRFSNQKDENAIIAETSEYELEEAKEKIINLEDKGKIN